MAWRKADTGRGEPNIRDLHSLHSKIDFCPPCYRSATLAGTLMENVHHRARWAYDHRARMTQGQHHHTDAPSHGPKNPKYFVFRRYALQGLSDLQSNVKLPIEV